MSGFFNEEFPRASNRRSEGRSSVATGKIPYRSLSYYIGRRVRAFARDNPLLSHPAVYEGKLAGVFDDPSAIILEDAYTLILDRAPMQDHFYVVRKETIGAIFIRIEELRHLEIIAEHEG